MQSRIHDLQNLPFTIRCFGCIAATFILQRSRQSTRHNGEGKEHTNSESISSNFHMLVRMNANFYPWKVHAATQSNSPLWFYTFLHWKGAQIQKVRPGYSKYLAALVTLSSFFNYLVPSQLLCYTVGLPAFKIPTFHVMFSVLHYC